MKKQGAGREVARRSQCCGRVSLRRQLALVSLRANFPTGRCANGSKGECFLLVYHSLTKASQKRRFHFGDGYLLAIDLLIPCCEWKLTVMSVSKLRTIYSSFPTPHSLSLNVAQWGYKRRCVYRYKPG
ncbi:hypothetical protein NOS3756_34620 [Nostoc sp. NIES-3756]|nr:hypothetical protein NOS3756_34620 [Nostoc sp. NIES-3756]BAY37739.1 hypothetical protein NIES2111_20800 [Nostoc sp. NIES-2111]